LPERDVLYQPVVRPHRDRLHARGDWPQGMTRDPTIRFRRDRAQSPRMPGPGPRPHPARPEGFLFRSVPPRPKWPPIAPQLAGPDEAKVHRAEVAPAATAGPALLRTSAARHPITSRLPAAAAP